MALATEYVMPYGRDETISKPSVESVHPRASFRPRVAFRAGSFDSGVNGRFAIPRIISGETATNGDIVIPRVPLDTHALTHAHAHACNACARAKENTPSQN